MTLAQIMTLALRQLDEDPEDISEYDDLFRSYANEGYRLAAEDWVKPRDTREAISDENGYIALDSDVRRVVEVRQRYDSGKIRRNVQYYTAPTGDEISVTEKNKKHILVVEVSVADMVNDTDEPEKLPKEFHPAIADYICYRHLSNGNMAKQSKAQFYRQSFYQAMARVRPQGMGSVKGFANLYAVTDIRYRG